MEEINVNFIKRALLSVKARKGKSLLQLVIFTVICVLVIAGLSIQSAAEKSAQLARESLGGTVTLQYNSEKMMEEMRSQMGERPERGSEPGGEGFSPFTISNEPVQLEDAEQLASSDYVKAYNFATSTTGYAEGFEAVEVESNSSSGFGGFGGFGQGEMSFSMGDISISGNLNTDLVSAFMDETATLVEGRHITEEDQGSAVVLIEQTLADQNELAVGDTIEFGTEDTKKGFEIVGIYQSDVSTDDLNTPLSAMLPYNTVYVPFDQANEIKGEDATDTMDSAVYYMKDAANIDAFISEAENTSIDFETYMLDANNAVYEQMVGPIENVSSFSKNIVYLVTIAGALILGLLIMLSIRERKYEMGVLIAIGERKWKLIGQFLIEVLIIAVIALGISYISGGTVADELGNKLLENQLVESQESQPESFRSPFGGGAGPIGNKTTQADVIDEIQVEITNKDFGMLALIGFLISLIATAIPSLTILRLKPKAILTKQD